MEPEMLLEILKLYTDQDESYLKQKSKTILDVANSLASVDPFELACEFMMDDEKAVLSGFLDKM